MLATVTANVLIRKVSVLPHLRPPCSLSGGLDSAPALAARTSPAVTPQPQCGAVLKL